jgi:hypothetical protein
MPDRGRLDVWDTIRPLGGGHPGGIPIAPHAPLSTPISALSRHPRFELFVLPRTPAVNVTEAELSSTLVTMVGRSQPSVSPVEVQVYLTMHF